MEKCQSNDDTAQKISKIIHKHFDNLDINTMQYFKVLDVATDCYLLGYREGSDYQKEEHKKWNPKH